MADRNTTATLAEHEKECTQCRDSVGWLDLCPDGYRLINPKAFPFPKALRLQLRDFFAAFAIAGLSHEHLTPTEAAKAAYERADAMLAQRGSDKESKQVEHG